MTEEIVLVGTSLAIEELRTEIALAARSDAKVLITGESGVGKEIVAREIHRLSQRRSGPLVTMNCAAIPDGLLESELFGHTRGSFTGAYRDRPGALESAKRGTLFLDEIGEMSLRMQALLLRFLETGELQRVGADRPGGAFADVRVIAATNRDLHQQVTAKTFRTDLFYRLNVIHVVIPPLRERREDIPALVRHFLRLATPRGTALPEVTSSAMDHLVAYGWPGNARQLRNVVERLVVRAGSGPFAVEHLPSEVVAPGGDAVAAPSTPPASKAKLLFERIVNGNESFWTVAYDPFIARDLTRADLRQLVTIGLEHTNGSYKLLTELFNLAPGDYKRLLGFLRKYECQVPFKRFRTVSMRLRDGGAPVAQAAPAAPSTPALGRRSAAAS